MYHQVNQKGQAFRDSTWKEADISESQKTEIIAFCSGKGGTGKTLLCSCLGFALTRGGQKTLMIDGDPATDGLSLFLLGQKGQAQLQDFSTENTFIGALDHFKRSGHASFSPHPIHRRGSDHGVTYEAVISGKGLYGVSGELTNQLAVPDLDRETFRAGIRVLFDELRSSGLYSYVLIDTRGGFAFESTDVCALADSFIVITEPDVTSFYQDRNLVSRISLAAKELDSPSVLRAMIVNKSTDLLHREGRPYLDNLEVSFRNELVKEFPITFEQTYPIPVDIEALLAYKVQKIPYVSSPGSMFSFATLAAYTDILGIVTSKWSIPQVDKWNDLVETVTEAVGEKNTREAEKEEAILAKETKWLELQAQVREGEEKRALLEKHLLEKNMLYEREFDRTQLLLKNPALSPQQKVAPPANRNRLLWIGLLIFLIFLTGLSFWLIARNRSLQQAANDQAAKAATTQNANTAAQLKILQDQAKTFQASLMLGAPEDKSGTAPSPLSDAPDGKYAVVLAAGTSLDAIGYEVDLIWHLGYKSVSVYERNGTYAAVILFRNSADARAIANSPIGGLKARYNNAYNVAISTWCPAKEGQATLEGRGYSVPVWACPQQAAKQQPAVRR